MEIFCISYNKEENTKQKNERKQNSGITMMFYPRLFPCCFLSVSEQSKLWRTFLCALTLNSKVCSIKIEADY